MPNCPKCGKPVYFAERTSSIGFDWHPFCLRCEECGKRLNPGGHSEHKGKPYCNAPCYSALFGPKGYGRSGVVVHANTATGEASDVSKGLMSKIKQYNAFLHGKLGELTSRELNGRIVFEGVMRIYWGLKKPIRLVATENAKLRLRSSFSEADAPQSQYTQQLVSRLQRQKTLNQSERRLRSESSTESEKQLLSVSSAESEKRVRSQSSTDSEKRLRFQLSTDSEKNLHSESSINSEKRLRSESSVDSVDGAPITRRRRSMRARKVSNAAALRPPGKRHGDAFVPPYGTYANLRLISSYTTTDVIKMLLEKFKVENSTSDYALYIVHDHGGAEPVKPDDYPLHVRLKLGPSEQVARIFIMDASDEARVDISPEIAEYINLAMPVLEGILLKYQEEEERAAAKIKQRYEIKRKQLRESLQHLQQEA